MKQDTTRRAASTVTVHSKGQPLPLRCVCLDPGSSAPVGYRLSLGPRGSGAGLWGGQWQVELLAWGQEKGTGWVARRREPCPHGDDQSHGCMSQTRASRSCAPDG